ncbi:MAG: transaldolase family protein [Patescibacteria group bacterium]
MKRLTQASLFVDTGDPGEAEKVQGMVQGAGYGGLDGATTNPSYFAKNPEVQTRIKEGKKYTREELLGAYREAVEKLLEIIPGGDISVEVYADATTLAEEMIRQAREMYTWIPTARIKLPTVKQGLIAAETLKNELRLNMTLCFSQQQAAAVYSATAGAKEPVVISPFVGRLDDRGENGVQFVSNVVRMLKQGDGHVKVLAASFRRVENILAIIQAGADILTINYERFQLWADAGFPLPDENFTYVFEGKDISYEEIELGKPWREYNLHHELTDVGLKRFSDDWNALLK